MQKPHRQNVAWCYKVTKVSTILCIFLLLRVEEYIIQSAPQDSIAVTHSSESYIFGNGFKYLQRYQDLYRLGFLLRLDANSNP